VEVSALVIEAIWKSVSSRIGTPATASAMPKARR
jgi:hypothetical protein